MRSAIFLDRDGTINSMVYRSGQTIGDSPWTPDEFVLLPSVGEAIRSVNNAGLLTVVVSNQPGVAKGDLTLETLDAITRKMHEELASHGARVDAVFYCTHHPNAVIEQYRIPCRCRKPSPGLLEEGAKKLEIDLKTSFIIGDSMKDIEAGMAAGCRTVWLGGAYSAMGGMMVRWTVPPNFVAYDLLDAINRILRFS